VGARLVHGDLSEYNILVAPVFQVDNPISSVEDTTNDLQAVLIDFGQAVDLRHPEAMNLLRRDLDRVRAFFKKQGVKTLDLEEAVEFVVDDFANEVFNESSNTLGVQNSLVDASVVE
jgi:RIO kinase 1